MNAKYLIVAAIFLLTACPKSQPQEEELPPMTPYTKEELEEIRERERRMFNQPKRKEQLQEAQEGDE